MRPIAPLYCGLAFLLLAGCRVNSAAASHSKSKNDSADKAVVRTEAESRRTEMARWCVRGKVVNEVGQPFEGVEIIAHSGEGTLRQTGSAHTNAQGEYELWFGEGVLLENSSPGLQAATITAHKAGWSERDLNWSGNLAMARRACDESELKGFGARCLVLPDQPQRVDFFMTPSATVAGRLIGVGGKPLGRYGLSLNAEKLPPSSSVLAHTETDPEGRFAFDSVPPGKVWFEIRAPGDRLKDVRSETIRLMARENGEYTLRVTAGTPDTLTVESER